LFEKFFLHYTKKQWNKEPKELSPTVCGRIPIRTNDDPRYFTDKYQYMPKDGYTEMFKKILSHKNIEIVLNTDYQKILNDVKFDKMIYTGPIDYFFDYKFGKLPYRSIRFEFQTFNQELYQPAAQINYVDDGVTFTRVVEHKYLSNQKNNKTTVSFEYSQQDGEPFYPIPTAGNKELFEKYNSEAKKNAQVIFIGRLAEYQYYNMDQVVASTLTTFERMQDGK
jgi:UDP-galactopyranose mutase